MESIIRGEKCSGLIANGAIWIMADFREELLLLPLTWSSGDVSSDHWPVFWSNIVEPKRPNSLSDFNGVPLFSAQPASGRKVGLVLCVFKGTFCTIFKKKLQRKWRPVRIKCVTLLNGFLTNIIFLFVFFLFRLCLFHN